MTANNNSNRLHPLIATAAGSVILLCLVGVAAITGVLPTSQGNTPAASVAADLPPGLPLTVTDAAAEEKAAATEKLASNETTHAAQPDAAPAPPVKQAAVPKPTPKPQPVHQAKSEPAVQPITRPAPYQPPVVAKAPVCHSCGRVESVYAVPGQGNSGIGVAAGTVVGGLLGNQIGKGNGRKVATVAGAIGGSLAGLEVERRMSTSYEVRVRMENGQVRTFPYNNQPPWQTGDRIRVVNGYLTAQG